MFWLLKKCVVSPTVRKVKIDVAPKEATGRIIKPYFVTLLYFLAAFGYSPLECKSLWRGEFRTTFSSARWRFGFFILFLLLGVAQILATIFQTSFLIPDGFDLFTKIWEIELEASTLTARAKVTFAAALRTTLALIPLIVTAAPVLEWLHFRQIGPLLEGWVQFEEELWRSFPEKLKRAPGLLKYSRTRVHLPSLMILLCFFIGVIVWRIYAMQTVYSVGAPFHSFSFFYFLVTGVISTGLDNLNEVYNIGVYCCAGKAFRNLHASIRYRMNASRRPVSVEEVRRWQHLLNFVRLQCNRTSDYKKIYELALTLDCILLATLTAFVGLAAYASGSSVLVGVSGMWLLYSIGRVAKLFFRAYAANQITDAESALCHLLDAIGPSRLMDETGRLQILIHGIRSNSCQIHFGNYMTLNKRHVLGVLGEVITYLIVLTQHAKK